MTGSESEGDVHGRNERRNDGSEKENDDNMRNAERENTSDTTDDDHVRHVGYNASGMIVRGTGPVSCVTGRIVGIGRRHNDS